MQRIPPPQIPAQRAVRTFFQVAGPLLWAVGAVMIVVGLLDFFAVFGGGDGFPTLFILVFLGGPLTAAGSWMMKAGYLGVAAQYTAGETMPVLKASLAYLTDGRGVAGLGHSVPDPATLPGSREPEPSPTDEAAGGPYCRECGRRNPADARFCAGCGRSVD